MKSIAAWASREPLRAFAVVQAVLAAAAPFIPAGATTAALGVLAALLGVGVRQAVTPVATAVESVTHAAVSAATTVARDLDGTTAGLEGTVSIAAERVIDRAVDQALGAR